MATQPLRLTGTPVDVWQLLSLAGAPQRYTIQNISSGRRVFFAFAATEPAPSFRAHYLLPSFLLTAEEGPGEKLWFWTGGPAEIAYIAVTESL